MELYAFWIVLLQCIISTRHVVHGSLECYECVTTNTTLFPYDYGDCQNPDGDVSVDVCGRYESCVYIHGVVHTDHSQSVYLHARGCLDVNKYNVYSGCEQNPSVHEVQRLLRGTYRRGWSPEWWQGAADIYDVSDVEMCYCNTDRCVAQPCNAGYVIGEYCMKIWLVVLLNILGWTLITGFCCCCCCCCCFRPCRANKPSGEIVQQSNQHPAVVGSAAVNVPHSSSGMAPPPPQPVYEYGGQAPPYTPPYTVATGGGWDNPALDTTEKEKKYGPPPAYEEVA